MPFLFDRASFGLASLKPVTRARARLKFVRVKVDRKDIQAFCSKKQLDLTKREHWSDGAPGRLITVVDEPLPWPKVIAWPLIAALSLALWVGIGHLIIWIVAIL